MNKKLVSILLLGILVSTVLSSGCKKEDENKDDGEKVDLPTKGNTGTFTDSRDNKDYKWIEIGSQVWMSENLAYTGSDIKNIADNYDWYDNTNADAWSYYNNNESNKSSYGVLYQWKAAGIACPDGWHLPTDAEWIELENYLKEKGYSCDGVVGNDKIAKSMALNSGWDNSSNLGAVGNSDFAEFINVSGFSASASGFRAYTGEFTNKSKECYWWSYTEDSSDIYGNYNLKFDSPKVYTFHDNKTYGFSVRCVKD